MKKYFLTLIIISIIFVGVIFILDIINITQYIQFTAQYDWLGFVGGYMGSIIGGIVTLFGVYQTIKYEKEKDFEKSKLNNKPYFYNIDPFSDYDYKSASEFILSEDSSYKNKKNKCQVAIIKNTDNAILVVDHMSISRINYYPTMGEVIDKNQIVYLQIFSNNDIELKDINLYIKDVLGNVYEYTLIYSDKEEKIVQLKEKVKTSKESEK